MSGCVCVLLGGGGHARILLDCLHAMGNVQVHGILDGDATLRGAVCDGVPVLGDDGMLASMRSRGVTHFVVGVGSIAPSDARKAIYDRCIAAGLSPLQVIHPSAVCSPRATLGAGVQILPGAVVNCGARIGLGVIVNSRAVIEHDCQIQDHAHIAPGAVLGGAVQVGAGAHIGIGAVVRQGLEIGAKALVGAGAVVVEDVAAGATVTGVPARARPL